MAFPHPQSGNDHGREKDKPSSGSIAWKFFERTINITEYRNAEDDVNPAKNPTFVGLFHDYFCPPLIGDSASLSIPNCLSYSTFNRCRFELHRVTTNDGADGNGKTGGSRCEFLKDW
jgi:hypothetical protein